MFGGRHAPLKRGYSTALRPTAYGPEPLAVSPARGLCRSDSERSEDERAMKEENKRIETI